MAAPTVLEAEPCSGCRVLDLPMSGVCYELDGYNYSYILVSGPAKLDR